MELIELRDVFKTYHLGEVDVPVLRGVSLSIRKGELAALRGVSGSGKTTLMNIIGCLDRPSSGGYWLGGEEVSKLDLDKCAPIRNSKIGFVFQSFNLLKRTSALENVMMPLWYGDNGMSVREAQERAKELLNRVGLSDRMNYEPSQLSGGQQQRVAIARSLVNRPAIVLADEPTGNLDSKSAAEILDMFVELNEREGVTVLVVTHDSEVARHTKRVIYIRDGRIEVDPEAQGASA